MFRPTATSLTTVVAAGFVLAAAGAAKAATDRCALIRAESQTLHSLTPATDGATPARIKASYAVAFAEGRQQALAAWHDQIERACPGKSPLWWRAHDRTVTECDRAMGGRFTVCAAARPAARIF